MTAAYNNYKRETSRGPAISQKVPTYAAVCEYMPLVSKEIYRGMEIDADQVADILKKGIDAPVIFNKDRLNPNVPVATTLKEHDNPTEPVYSMNSIYVSTSHSRYVAAEYATQFGSSGYVFKITVPGNKGIDFNKARGDKSRVQSNQEVSIIGRVAPENIEGYYPIARKGDTIMIGKFVPTR